MSQPNNFLGQLTPQELRRLAARPLFKNVPEDQIACFLADASFRRFATGTLLLTQNEHAGVVLILLEGSVKISLPDASHLKREKDDCNRILNILGPGEILGELDAIDGKGHSASVETLEPTRCLCIPAALFDHCLQETPNLSYNLLHVVVARIRHLTNKSGALTGLNISGRLAYQLLSLAERYGELDEQGKTLIPIRLTQKTLAGLSCTSREHINKKFARFRQNNLLSIDTNLHISLHDLERLRQECQ